MFERFTPEARHVVVMAQEESRRLCHDFIGPEHIFLGLFDDDRITIAGEVLQVFEVNKDQAYARVQAIVGCGDTSPFPGHIPFTPRAKAALEVALREALQLGYDYVGSEHILLGLVREEETHYAKADVEDNGKRLFDTNSLQVMRAEVARLRYERDRAQRTEKPLPEPQAESPFLAVVQRLRDADRKVQETHEAYARSRTIAEKALDALLVARAEADASWVAVQELAGDLTTGDA